MFVLLLDLEMSWNYGLLVNKHHIIPYPISHLPNYDEMLEIF